MAFLSELARRLWYRLNRGRFDRALEREMAAHRAMMPDPSQFGNVRRLREDAHDQWGFRWIDDLVRDTRLGLRTLARSKSYTVVAIASLALAIGVTATTAAVVNAYLVRSLPYPEADRLYHLQYAPPGPWEPAGLSGLDWSAPPIDAVAEHAIATQGETMFVTDGAGGGYPDPSRGLRVSPGFLAALGVRAVRGRVLGPEDYRDSAEPAPVMISHRLWRERFAESPGVIGQPFSAELDSRARAPGSFVVAGLLPDGFWFGTDSRDLVDVIMPLRTPARVYRIRLREGVAPDAAADRINAAVRQIARDLPPNWPGVTLTSARDRYVATLRPILKAATITSALLLAIACANLAGLTLLRSLRRQKEIGVRLALGAGRARIMRMLVVEAGVLVSIATAIGLGLAWLALAALGPAIAVQLGRPAPGGAGALGIDVTVVLAVAALGALIAVALPMLWLLTPWGGRIAASLRRDGRASTEGRHARRSRSVFIAAQVAGALALLIGSGLMMQSLLHMTRTEYGVRTTGLVRAIVDFAGRAGADQAALVSTYDLLLERVSPISRAPVPLFQWPQFAETPKQPVETGDASRGAQEIGVIAVSAPYFDVLGIRAIDGRLFTDADRLGSAPVAVLSASAARRLWPSGAAIGQQVRLAERFISGLARDRNWRTVVGIVADVRQTYDDRDTADVYVPFFQAPPDRTAWLYVATNEPADKWGSALREAIASVDPKATVRIAVPIELEAARQWAAPMFLAWVITACAAFSLIFAVLGIYGVTAFSLQQREREIAIRSALGATRRRLVLMVLREWGLVLALGLASGLAASVAVGRALSAQMFGVKWLDLPTWAAATVLLAAVALIAAWRPAARATAASPVTGLNDI